MEEKSRGAIIPTGYSIQRYTSGLSFKCPVIGCHAAFANAPALGGHFCSGHKNSAYNDNCDGTLGRVGRFAKIAGSTGAAIVVSQIPKALDMASATVADRLALDDQARNRRSKIQQAAVKKTNTVPEIVADVAFQNGKVIRSHAVAYLLTFYGGVNGYAANFIYELSQFLKRCIFT